MTDDFLEKEREMEASDTERKDLQEARRRLNEENGWGEEELEDYQARTQQDRV